MTLYDGNAGLMKKSIPCQMILLYVYMEYGIDVLPGVFFFNCQVKLSTEHSIGGLSDEILNCGYTGAISVQNKESIVRYARTRISVCLGKYDA